MKTQARRKKLDSRSQSRNLRRIGFAAVCAVASQSPFSAIAQTAATNAAPTKAASSVTSTNKMQEVVVSGSFVNVIPTEPVQSVIGFNKTVLETPRSVSVLTAELLKDVGIQNVEDLYRVAPSTYTTFRFGLQGGIQVRNQAGDYYFRGIKKPDPQGNYRTIFTAFDSLDVVRGPASPIFGGGRVGGYINFNPKTARSAEGKYLSKAEGKISLSFGSWDREVATLEYGGPVKGLPGDRKAGFYYFGYLENSGSFYDTGFEKNFVNQIAFSADISDNWRLETGMVSQFSKGGLNGGVNRITDSFFTNGKYWSGKFATKLDANGDGKISDRELFGSRPAAATYNPIFVNFGTISTPGELANLQKQTVDATGKPIGPIKNIVTGAAIGSGASLLTTMPAAFTLDYSSFKEVDVNYSATLGEDYYQADIYDFFLDVINDSRPSLTMKNQLFYHFYNQVKDGRNPFSQIQEPSVFEEKFVASHKAGWLPDWWDATFLVSPNFRFTDTYRANTTNGDYDRRRDLSSGPDGGFSPNDTFFSFLKDTRGLDGSAITLINDSKYWEAGMGVMADQTFFEKLNILAGGRFDHVSGDHRQPAGVFAGKNAATVGTTAALDSRLTSSEIFTSGSDNEWSWNASMSYKLPFNIVPYVTIAQQAALIVDASDASIARATWLGGAYGKSELMEAGIKTSMFKEKLFLTVAAFRQNRISFAQGDSEASVDKTQSEGIEAEVRWEPKKGLSVVGSAVFSKATYLAGSDQTLTISGRMAGFSDVIDPGTGKVIVPAEAFVWGGNPQVRILGGDVFPEVPGVPDKILNLFVTYRHESGFGGAVGVSHQGSFASDRTLYYQIPEATVLNVAAFYDKGPWSAKVDVKNATDELYFTRGAGSGTMIGVRQPISYEFTITRSF